MVAKLHSAEKSCSDFSAGNVRVFCSFIRLSQRSVVCVATYRQPLLKRVLHKVRASAFSSKSQDSLMLKVIQ